MKLYMVVTKDRYELPLFVTSSIAELSEITGKDVDTIHSILSKWRHGKTKRPCIIQVEVDDDED